MLEKSRGGVVRACATRACSTVEVGVEAGNSLYKLTSYTIEKGIFSAF